MAFKLLSGREGASFGAWMDAGATTLWEYWVTDEQRSLSHPMFGAVVAEMLGYVLGIRQEKGSTGWHNVLVAPVCVKELPTMRGHITTPFGLVHVNWHHEKDQVHFEITVPHGIHARFKNGTTEKTLVCGVNIITCALEEE